jgi:hypothetical protein
LLGQQDSPSQFTQDRTEASTSQTESANNDDKEQCQAGSSQINCEAETDSEVCERFLCGPCQFWCNKILGECRECVHKH